METIKSASMLDQYPSIGERQIDALLKRELAKSRMQFVVLDDDPTGVQTVHGISVYTGWDAASMREAFSEDKRLFYILTNSRAMTAAESERVHREILYSVADAAEKADRQFLLISRSDSTLRGHYPLETETLREGLRAYGAEPDGEILFPFFREGNRFTLHGIHYVRYGESLVPAAQTEFAKDPTFGYMHSWLPAYIEEKTEGRYAARDVLVISIEDLRACRIDQITEQLMRISGFGKVCVDSIDECDVKVFCIALYRAIAKGRRFLLRTAAGFVKIVGGISDKPLLTGKELFPHMGGMTEVRTNQYSADEMPDPPERQYPANGGLVLAGSYTARTSEQLEELLKEKDVVPVPFRSGTLLESRDAFDREIRRCLKEEEQIIKSGKTAVCYTERTLLQLPGDTKEDMLKRSLQISSGVRQLAEKLTSVPSFIAAKGGITSAEIGTKALQVKKADVLGQIQPGVPVWKTGPESKFPGIPYVIFPGNVGEEDTLRKTVQILMEGLGKNQF